MDEGQQLKRERRGGARPGAGRPKGAKSKLPQGAKKALRTLRWRVPEGTPDDLANLADWAMRRIRRVAAGHVDASVASSVLKAATVLREEVCGPVAQKLEHSGEVRTVNVTITRTVKGSNS